jgi:iron complex outermembrane recepter protein
VYLRQVYTLNDFYFEHDPIYGGNALPAVPRHVYQAELGFDQPTGVYAAVNVSSVLSNYAVDFANSASARSYAVWGARGGYVSRDGRWEGFVEVGNIFDKHYAAIVSPIFDAAGGDRPVYAPGLTRNVSAGVTFHF